MVRGDYRAVTDVYMITITCDAVDAMTVRCAECIPHVLTSMAYCFFVFMCFCGGFIYGDSLPIEFVMVFHGVALILCYCDGCINEYFVIILIQEYVFVYFVNFLFMSSHGGTNFELAVCASRFACLTRIG